MSLLCICAHVAVVVVVSLLLLLLLCLAYCRANVDKQKLLLFIAPAALLMGALLSRCLQLTLIAFL